MSKSRRQAGQEFCRRAPAFLFQQHFLLQPKGAEERGKSEGEEENGGANNGGEKATGCTSGTGEADTAAVDLSNSQETRAIPQLKT